MKHYYFVILAVRNGEFEDFSNHLFSSKEKMTKQEVIEYAFDMERRGELQWEDDQSAYDLGGEIYLKLYNLHHPTKAEYKTLQKYVR